MSSDPSFWFPAKRYGWGWGPPVVWQGWGVLVLYLALVFAGVFYFEAQRRVVGLLVYLVGLTVALIVVVAVKGEKPLSWRWGHK